MMATTILARVQCTECPVTTSHTRLAIASPSANIPALTAASMMKASSRETEPA